MAIKLELEKNECEIIVAGLYKLAMEIAEPIKEKIKLQAIPQIEEQAKANPQTQVAIDEAEANSDSMVNE